MPVQSGTIVGSPISKGDKSIKIGTHFDDQGVGGFMVVATLADRDALPIDGTSQLNVDGLSSGQRKVGMRVYVHEDQIEYELVVPGFDALATPADKANALADNANWVVKAGGSWNYRGELDVAAISSYPANPKTGDFWKAATEGVLSEPAVNLELYQPFDAQSDITSPPSGNFLGDFGGDGAPYNLVTGKFGTCLRPLTGARLRYAYTKAGLRSVRFWVKFAGSSATQGSHRLLIWRNGGGYVTELVWDASTQRFITIGGAAYGGLQGPATFAAEEWLHLEIRIDHALSSIQLYINGSLTNTVNAIGPDGIDNIEIGNVVYANDVAFDNFIVSTDLPTQNYLTETSPLDNALRFKVGDLLYYDSTAGFVKFKGNGDLSAHTIEFFASGTLPPSSVQEAIAALEANKQEKDAFDTLGNVAEMDGMGDSQDSGIPTSSLVLKSDLRAPNTIRGNDRPVEDIEKDIAIDFENVAGRWLGNVESLAMTEVKDGGRSKPAFTVSGIKRWPKETVYRNWQERILAGGHVGSIIDPNANGFQSGARDALGKPLHMDQLSGFFPRGFLKAGMWLKLKIWAEDIAGGTSNTWTVDFNATTLKSWATAPLAGNEAEYSLDILVRKIGRTDGELLTKFSDGTVANHLAINTFEACRIVPSLAVDATGSAKIRLLELEIQ